MNQQPNIHELKCWPEYFKMIESGIKQFEVRKNDRGFKVGDILIIKEYMPDGILENDTQKDGELYTGNYCKKEVTHIIKGGQFGIEKGFCIMILKDTFLI